MIRREQDREWKRKCRDLKKKLTVKLNLKRRANIGEYCMTIGLNNQIQCNVMTKLISDSMPCLKVKQQNLGLQLISL